MPFGENLKHIRSERGITQEQLAERMEVSRQAISKWESGNGFPETDKLIQLSEELNVSLDYLIKDKSNSLNTENQTSVYSPGGKIFIKTFNSESLVSCQAVKSSQVVGNSKAPKYILFGFEGVGFGGEKTQLLGWYKIIDDIQSEIAEINQAILEGKLNYELHHFVKVEYTGLLGQPHIVE